MALRRTLTGWMLIGLLGGALGQGCGSSSSKGPRGGSGASTGASGKDGGSQTVSSPGVSGAAGESPYDPLCGVALTQGCIPGADSTCGALPSGTGGATSGTGGTGATSGTGGTGATSGTGGTGATSGTGGTGAAGTTATGGRGGTGAAPGGAGAAGESGALAGAGGESLGGAGAGAPSAGGAAPGGQGGEDGGSTPPTAGSPSGTSGSGSGGSSRGGTGGTGQPPLGSGGSAVVMPEPSSVSCQVMEDPKHKGRPITACRVAGAGAEGAACFSGADCAPGFACVGDGPGLCRAYCCEGASECSRGTRCSAEPLVLDPAPAHPLDVPVCVPAIDCSLAEPYPCDPNTTCTCPEHTACVVVSDRGTTSCVADSKLPEPGQGEEGQDCPCAWGYVCSRVTSTCVKLCELDNVAPYCDSGRCQASTALPAGWGTCVGVAPKDAGSP